MAQNKNTHRKKNQKANDEKASLIRKLWIAFWCMWGLVILFFFSLCMGWLGMPSFEELENPRSNQASEVISADGEILGFIGFQNRSNITYDQLSPNLVNALVATEDVRFYKHSGIDARSLGRVVVKTLIGRHKGSGGGSTITQQLAKNLFTRERLAKELINGKKSKKLGKVGLVYSKFKEWVLAVKLEHNYSKDEIITMYFNTVDFGSNAFGIKTAAKTFFNATPDTLGINESAMLVGLLKAPTAYNPKRHYDNALKRRNTVLYQMKRYDYLPEERYDSLSVLPVDTNHFCLQSHNDGLATYFREYVRNYMKDWCKTTKCRKPDGSRYNVHEDGLRIYTTIDSRMQRYAEAAVTKHMGGEIQPAFFKEIKGRNGDPFVRLTKEEEDKILTQAMKQTDRYQDLKKQGLRESEIRKIFDQKVEMRVFSWKGGVKDTLMSPWDSLLYHKKFLNAGLMSVEPGTGYVRAYVGGINYRFFKYDNVWSHRQVGSTFKPFVYTMALKDLGMYPCTVVPNMQVCISPGPGQKTWCPRNSNPKEDEVSSYSLKNALAQSVNWTSAYLMQQAIIQTGGNPQSGDDISQGPAMVVQVAHDMGIESKIDPVPSICVGTPELTVYEMAAAMATLANGGEYVKPIFITRIEDSKGNVLQRFSADERREALSPQVAYMMLTMMKGVVESGTGYRLKSRYGVSAPTAGKTGTTQNCSDGWFIGITPTLSTAVWGGGEIRSIHFRGMTYGQGAAMALPIYGYYMQGVYNDPTLKFPRNDFISPGEIEYECGEYQELEYQGGVMEEGGWEEDYGDPW